ncbi:MAG TPA: EAL domain-containing protein [Candidatus Baltobacteraceae bacterium]|nr:EAL domain-containing protein [Candidatus Baltobacteraceae bacterium]
MVRQPATVRALTSWSGIIVTVVSAALLGVVFWQISQLDALGGLSPAALDRDQLALRAASDLSATWDAVDDFRDSLVLGDAPMRTQALRSVIDARMRALDVLFGKTGPAAEFDPNGDWATAQKAWSALRKAPPGELGMPLFNKLAHSLDSLIFDLNNGSGLNYDTQQTQNIADIVFNLGPEGADRLRRLVLMSTLAVREGGLKLQERLSFYGALGTMQGDFDLSQSDVPNVLKMLTTLMPARAKQWQDLVPLAKRYEAAGKSVYKPLYNEVLFKSRPTIDPKALQAVAQPALTASRDLSYQVSRATGAMVARRGEIYNQRRTYFYVALLLGGLLLVGLMLLIAQIVAYRSGQALERAHRESERLAVELARQKAEEALRLTEAQFRAVFEGAALGIAVLDRGGNVVDANGVFRALFGDSVAAALDGHEQELAELLAGERETFEYEQHLRTALGQEVWTDATISVVHEQDGKPLFAICMFRDKTALKHSERRILHDKTHDSLTGLPNRWLFEEQLRRRFEEATALLDSFFAVLFIDLEHFRDINESLGHGAGDSVLTQVAQRLRSSVDARDVVARLGSDEFAILLQSLGDILHVESVARRILNNLSKVITINGRSIYLGASVGIAIGSASYEHAEDVMRDAEIAMQHSKIGGGTRYALFDSKMQDRAQKRLQLTSDIRQALERNEFRLLYQPIVSIVDGTPVGCEALLRWDHPSEGVMGPMEFMPIAETTGLATPIGRFVVNTACEQLSQWRRNRNGRMDFNVHVNISAAELVDVDLERALVQAIEHHGLAPEDLTIEITESVVLDSGTRANVMLERIRDRGFKICIDDFGTGYSSLRYLQQFKVDAIKIDRGFVSGSDGELASEPIVRTLMTLAEAFDVKVVAEGVETVRQREILRNAGCRLAQGFLYARPISAAEMVTLYPDVLGRMPRTASA